MRNKFLLISIIFYGISSFAQVNKEVYKAFNESLTLSIENDSISIYALIAKGKENKETIILLHGLPGNEKNLDLAENIRQNGKNAIYFNYRGSWGSQGEFLYSNCLKDISKVIDYLTKDDNTRKLRIKKNNITLIGHSLGGGIAILQGINDKRVTKIIALSTFNAGEELKNTNSINELKDFIKYLDEQFVLNINSKEFLTEIIKNKKGWNLSNIASTKNKPILFIDENNRNERWIDKFKIKEYKIINSDHSFSDKRKELSNEIIKWLNKN